jgi:hypothetical protein
MCEYVFVHLPIYHMTMNAADLERKRYIAPVEDT